MRQRKKSDKLLVWYPQKGWIFHSTNESTYLKVLKYIGGERLSKVALKISHLPIFTKEPYPQFSKYMKSIGAGWFVNTIGGTASKYAQLNTINEQLHLNMKVKLVSDDVFDDMFPFAGNYTTANYDLMKTDVKDMDDHYEVDIDLPGFKKDEVNAELKDGYITISASKGLDKDEKDKKTGKYIRQERYVGSMSRSFYVGENVTQEEVKAKFEDGILQLTIPKKDVQTVEQKNYIAIE